MRASLAGRSAVGIMFGEILPCTEQLFQLLTFQAIGLAQPGACEWLEKAPQWKITQDLAATIPWQCVELRDFRAGPEKHAKLPLRCIVDIEGKLSMSSERVPCRVSKSVCWTTWSESRILSPWTGRTPDAKYRIARVVSNLDIARRLIRSLRNQLVKLLHEEQVPCAFCPRPPGQGEVEQGHGARKTRAGVVR